MFQLVLGEAEPVFFDEDEDSDVVPKPGPADSGMRLGFSKSEEKGLSELVRRCLGRPLNKGEQMSNWENRPLRVDQIRYAGKDSF